MRSSTFLEAAFSNSKDQIHRKVQQYQRDLEKPVNKAGRSPHMLQDVGASRVHLHPGRFGGAFDSPV